MSDDTKTRVTVLCGGTSAEREISLASGANVIQALKEAGYEVSVLDPQDATWIDQLTRDNPDVVFPMLHGRGGEDGTVQALCELLHLPYVGSGVLASALALNKVRAKQIYAAVGLPTPSCCAIQSHNQYDVAEMIERLGAQLVVKPATEGSSLGMSIVRDATPTTLQTAIQQAFSHDDIVLVETYISGTEVTVPVLGNEYPHALPTIEIVPSAEHEFYDYEAKYVPHQSAHIIPSRLGEQVNEQLARLAEQAHAALGCRGFSRTDFLVTIDAKSALHIYLIETNTLPGMTDTSLVPDAARVAGITMPELVRMLVDFALA